MGMLDRWYALTEEGYDRATSGKLTSSSIDVLLDTLADFEEAEPLQPHSFLQILEDMKRNVYWSYDRVEKALREGIRRGYLEEIYEWDERFPEWR